MGLVSLSSCLVVSVVVLSLSLSLSANAYSSRPSQTRRHVAIQGVVYCKSCKYRGVDSLREATPLSGAVVKLQCYNSRNSFVEQKATDHNGYFFFMPDRLTAGGSPNCKVFLISSPSYSCNIPTNLHGGTAGASLTGRTPVDKQQNFDLYTVGPFAFDAPNSFPCHY